MAERSSSSTRTSRKYTWWSSESHSLGEDGKRVVCSGCQGRNDLGFGMHHSLAQILCNHWDFGRSAGVCREIGRWSTRDTLLVAISGPAPQSELTAYS